MFETAQIRGYRANLQGAVNACENGATVELDLRTVRVLIEICRQAENYQDTVSILRASQGSGATEDARRCIADALQPKFGFLLGGMPRAMAEELASVALEALAALSPPATPQAPEDVRDRVRQAIDGLEILPMKDGVFAIIEALDRAHLLATPVTVTMEECRQIAHSVYANNTQQLAEALRRVLPGRIQIVGSEGLK